MIETIAFLLLVLVVLLDNIHLCILTFRVEQLLGGLDNESKEGAK